MLDKEVQDPLKRYAISSAQVGIFFSQLFTVTKKAGGQHSIKKKCLNSFLDIKCFK